MISNFFTVGNILFFKMYYNCICHNLTYTPLFLEQDFLKQDSLLIFMNNSTLSIANYMTIINDLKLSLVL